MLKSTPKDVKLPSLTLLVRRVRRAQTEEGESEATADPPEGASPHMHARTNLLVSNEGLKSESIMNFPSGGPMAP